MKLYEVKALAHETQSRIRQDLNAWNDFLEHASRVYSCLLYTSPSPRDTR